MQTAGGRDFLHRKTAILAQARSAPHAFVHDELGRRLTLAESELAGEMRARESRQLGKEENAERLVEIRPDMSGRRRKTGSKDPHCCPLGKNLV